MAKKHGHYCKVCGEYKSNLRWIYCNTLRMMKMQTMIDPISEKQNITCRAPDFRCSNFMVDRQFISNGSVFKYIFQAIVNAF